MSDQVRSVALGAKAPGPMSTEPETPSESFASLFETEQKQNPKRGRARTYNVGESVQGVVFRIGKDAVFVELDGKAEGYIEDVELKDADGQLTVKMGDTVRAVVVERSSDGGVIRLGKSAPKGQGAEGLMRAKESGLPVEGVVSGVNKGGLEVTVDGMRAFCPSRAVDTRFVSDLETYVGQRLKFIVTAVKEGGREVTLSRRAVLEQEQQEARAKIQDKLVVGAVLRGRVSSTREFGAFVDLGGVEGLLPASELSHDRALRPDDVVKVGDEIDVQVLKIEPDPKRPDQQKLTLSLKALAGDPWETAATKLPEGSIHEGRVMRLAAFGAFVQLAPGLDGLLHVSEMSGEMGPDGAPVMPKVGDAISVRVLKVDSAQRRIGLAPSDAPAKPGRPARGATASSITQGAIVTGKISRIEPFGVFVQIDGAQARGLLPAQELQRLKAGDLHKTWPIGTDVRAKVVSVDGSGKIRLSINAAKDDEERATFDDYRAKEYERSGGAMGALGQKLKQAGLLGAQGKSKKK